MFFVNICSSLSLVFLFFLFFGFVFSLLRCASGSRGPCPRTPLTSGALRPKPQASLQGTIFVRKGCNAFVHLYPS